MGIPKLTKEEMDLRLKEIERQENTPFAKLKFRIGDIQFAHLSMSPDKKYIEANPATHRIAEYVQKLLKQESTAFARWLDTYNHPIGERQSFETLYDIYKNKP